MKCHLGPHLVKYNALGFNGQIGQYTFGSIQLEKHYYFAASYFVSSNFAFSWLHIALGLKASLHLKASVQLVCFPS